MNSRRNVGFTLIELLVVVLIVGILASIAVPQYFKVVEKARVSEAMSLASAIKSAQERYLAGGGTYGTDFTKLDISYPNMTSSLITLKYFSASLAQSSGSGNSPGYKLNLVRHANSSSVAPRYGLYTITIDVPNNPIPTIGTCGGGDITVCSELVN